MDPSVSISTDPGHAASAVAADPVTDRRPPDAAPVGGGCPVAHHHPADAPATTPERSLADRRMRRLLRLPEHGPRVSIMDAQNAFGKSIAISAARCLLTYVALPLLAPIVDLSGVAGPILGLVLGLISAVAIFFATRRFFAADHKWRWGYTAIAAGIYVLLFVQAAVDIAHLLR